MKFFSGQDNLKLFYDIFKLCNSKQIFAVKFSKKYIVSKQP